MMTIAELKTLKTNDFEAFSALVAERIPNEHECKIITRILLDFLNHGQWPEYNRVHMHNHGRLYWFRHISHGALRPSPEEIDGMVNAAIDRLQVKGLLHEDPDTTVLHPTFLLQVSLGLVP